MDDHFTFTSPPECPIFRPTKEEFRDPLEYIDQIKPIAVKSGICKIIPPDDWRPPFSVNVNTFQFTPRVQKLYELEGNDKLKIPNINGRHVDLYKLHKLVNESGGYEHVTANKLWPKIGNKLGYKLSNQVYSLRTHYEKIILPYDLMIASSNEATTFNGNSDSKPKPVLHPSTTKKRKSVETSQIDLSLLESSNELKRLQFVGAGPRMYNGTKEELKTEEELTSGPLKRKCLSDYICKVCGSGDKEDRLLICDNDECQASYHCDCLVPPIIQIPKQSWKCHNCVLKVLNTKPAEYGFPSSSTTYTLYDFGRSADRFKANYFGKELHEVVPCSVVEKEFWRILQSFNDDVIVEYGADIHSSHQGSGFPTLVNIANGKCTRNNGEPNMDLALKYAKEPWNLNNLPVNKRSILSYIRGNIDGMKVPWCYVGMVFSSFCWHIEDHWSFSINYLHWGEPKTWYGVPSEYAPLFEATMKKQAPELFEHHEDLLHHITTTMNPNILQREGVPVHRADQHAGQFIVTFPRAYHTGFNQGFNFAEAVNFCPASWMPMGRACIEHYTHLRRHCVFSHEELMCTIAEAALLEQDKDNEDTEEMSKKYPLVTQLGLRGQDISLDTNMRRVVHSELEMVVAEEEQWRVKVRKRGITKEAERLFETMNDDERACDVCQTTLFLSALQCECVIDQCEEAGMDEKRARLVCLRHVDDQLCGQCTVEQCTFIYRYRMEQLETLVTALEVRLQDFHEWETTIKVQFTEVAAHADGTHKRATLEQLRLKLEEGAECGYDSCEEYVKARAICDRGVNLVAVCDHWLRVVQEKEDVSGGGGGSGSGGGVPKSVLVDCVNDNDGGIEIRNINVASITEDNLTHMCHTLTRYPVALPCASFEDMVTRLLRWRHDSHRIMDTAMSNKAEYDSILPRIVALFEEAKTLFPGWSAFCHERTCLMLIGKSMQWLVRIRECEDTVKIVKSGVTVASREYSLCLPQSLVTDVTVLDMVTHGQTLLVTLRDTMTSTEWEHAHRFLSPVVGTIDTALTALYDVTAEMTRVKDESVAMTAKKVLSSLTQAQILSSLATVTEHCLCLGVRIKETDECRVRLYKACVDTVLAGGGGGVTTNGGGGGHATAPRRASLEYVTQIITLGAALFTESVLDRNNNTLTQRHLAAKTQLAMVTRAVRKIRHGYLGVAGGGGGGADTDDCGRVDAALLRVMLPRHFSRDGAVNEARLAQNTAQFTQAWNIGGQGGSDGHVSALMTLYQAMLVDELASIDQLVPPPVSPGDPACAICGHPAAVTSMETTTDRGYCELCAPRTRRPTITDMAQLNKVLKQSASIVSIYGVALQALSKRTVTWLESLVTVVRVNVPLLAKYYWPMKDDSALLPVIPLCIKELFTADTKRATNHTQAGHMAELLTNLRYLATVGHCLEVNLHSYLTIIAALISAMERDIHSSASLPAS